MKLKLRESDISDGKWIGLVVSVLMWTIHVQQYTNSACMNMLINKRAWLEIGLYVLTLYAVFTLGAKHGAETKLIGTKPKIMYERYNITPAQKLNKGQSCNYISITCYTQL